MMLAEAQGFSSEGSSMAWILKTGSPSMNLGQAFGKRASPKTAESFG